ncbi:MAG: GGDEF-domain containing protein, partial [Pseudomonadota bacterium]
MSRKRGDPLSERVRRTLVTTLYTQPTSLAIGAINGIGATAVAACISDLQVLYAGCIVLTVIAVSRVAAAFGLAPQNNATST